MQSAQDYPYVTRLDILYPQLDLEDRTAELQTRQGLTVPKGVVHRTRAPERAVILMVENAGIVPTGDA